MATNRLGADVWSALAAGVVLAGGASREAAAQLVVSDNSGAAIVLIDLSGTNPPRTLASMRASSIAADEVHQVLYWVDTSDNLWTAPYSTSGALSPVQIGATSSNTFGLAYDSASQQLMGAAVVQDNAGVIATRLVSIDTSTGAATTIVTLPDWFRVAGLDFDSVTGAFYATNTTNLTSSEARFPQGVYRLSKPLPSTTPVQIAGFPGNAYSGANAAAAGNGRVFVVGGVAPPYQPAPANPHSAFNLATGLYEPLPALPVTLSNGAAWAPGLIAPPAGTNLVVTAGASDACSVPPGGTLKFSVRIDNYGGADSGPVTLTINLPGSEAVFAGSTPPPTSSTATLLTYVLPSIPGYGVSAYANVALQFTAVTPGASVAISATATVAQDNDLANNTTGVSTSIQPTAPAFAPIKGVLSTLATHSTSLLPGSATERITSFREPIASADGNWWSVRVGTSAGRLPGQPDRLLINDAVIRSTTGGVPQTLVHAVTTTTGRGKLTLKTANAINNAGRVAIAGDDYSTLRTTGPVFLRNFPADSLSLIATTSDGVSFTEIARQGNPIPALPGENYNGFQLGATGMFDNDTVGFWYNLSGSSHGAVCYFTNSGINLLARETVTTPTGASNVLNYLPATFTLGNGPLFDASGSHSMMWGRIDNPSNDAVIVVDNEVVLQQGVTNIPGAGRTYSGGEPIRMGPDGSYMIFDESSSGPDVVVRGSGTTITEVFKTGDPIFTGATEVWSDLRDTGLGFNPTSTFFTYQPGPRGHYVVGGYTDAADVYADSVLVYDNRVVIARENDPVDLDGNGVFDDDVYIRSFVYTDAIDGPRGNAAFTDDHAILIAVSLRNGASALCHVNDPQYPWALVRIPLPYFACNAADVAGLGGSAGPDEQLTVDDLVYFLSQFFAGNTAVADIAVLGSTPGHDGLITVDDLVYFLSQFFGGCGS